MAKVTVFYGHAYDGKNEDTFKRCLEKIRRQAGDSCLYLVRSDVRVRQLRDVVLRELGGCFHFPVTTLPDFIHAFYRESPGARRVLGNLEQKLLVAEILRARAEEYGPQFYFRRFRDHQGIIAKITEFIASVRRIGIASPQELAEKLNPGSERRRPVRTELVTIFERYLEGLETARAIDDPGIFLEIARRAVAGQLDIRSYLAAPELLVLESYYELTRPEQQILNALCAQFERSIVTLDAPLNPYRFPLAAETPKPFRIFREMVGYLQAVGCSVRETRRKATSPHLSRQGGGNPPLTPPRRGIESHLPRSEGVSEPSFLWGRSPEQLTLTAYRNRQEEVTEIAREIRRLHRERKITALREVGVTFPVIEPYARLIREIFPRFGLPVTMFQGHALVSAPVVITIFRLLAVVLEGYSREALGKLFSSSFVQFASLNAETYPDLDALAGSLGIVAGKENWQAKLTPEQAAAEQQRVTGVEPGHSSVGREKAFDLLPSLFGLLDFFAHFDLKEPQSPKTLIALLLEGIRQLQIPQRLLRSAHDHLLETETAALRMFRRLLETLEQALTASARRLTLPEFYDELRLAVQGETYYPPETLEDSVFIMGRLDTRQVRFTYLFFGGLVERDFPGPDAPNIFLPEQEAEALGLPTYQQRRQEADHLFYVNLLNPTAKLYLSHPLQEDDAELLRSTYLDRGLAALAKKDVATVGEGTPEGALQRNPEAIFTYTELYQWLGDKLRRASSAGTEEALQFIATEKGRAFAANFLDGLQAQALRTASGLSSFDGILAANWSKSFLRHNYANHIYTASEFDQYVCCPIKFFCQRVLRLKPLPVIATEVSAPEISRLLHRIAARFYNGVAPRPAEGHGGNVDHAFLRRRTDKAPWRQEARRRMAWMAREELNLFLEAPALAKGERGLPDPLAKGKMDARFAGVFWERFTDFLFAGLPETEGAAGDLSANKQGLLSAFIECEADDADLVWPCYLDAHFGGAQNEFGVSGAMGYVLSANPLRIRTQDVHGRSVTIKVKGTIDRIDLEPLAVKAKRRAVVYEYKTGAIPSVKKIKAGQAFQLPLYLLAVQEFLGQTVEVVAGGYYHLAAPEELGKKGHLGSKEYAAQKYFHGSFQALFDTQEEFLQTLADYQTRVVQAAQAITAGNFQPTQLGPQNAGCAYCEYARICRVDHQRMRLFPLKVLDK